MKKEGGGGKELLQSERERFLSPSWYIPTLLHTHSKCFLVKIKSE